MAEFKSREYWEARFEEEPWYDWLASWDDIREHLVPRINRSDAVLIVGNGNSPLPLQMAADGYTSLTCVDFAEPAMRRLRSAALAKGARGVVCLRADVRDMRGVLPDDGQFDVVLDKAAMDAVVADQSSPWTPSASAKRDADAMVRECLRVLRPGGLFIQVTFHQPLFRRRYLRGVFDGDGEGETKYQWTVEEPPTKLDVGLGYYIWFAAVGSG